MTTTTPIPLTRTGKIARLPRTIRETLNHRLADGEPGNQLLDWLNQQPLVQETLARLFEGRAITPQNLSEWRKGGYQDWLRHQENLTSATLALEEAQDLEAECGGQGHGLLSDRLSSLAALALAKTIRTAAAACDAAPDSAAARRALLEAIQTLTTLRYADHQAARLKITLERWEDEKAELAKTRPGSPEDHLLEFMKEITGVTRPNTPSPSPSSTAPEDPPSSSKAVPALSPSESSSSLPAAPVLPTESESIQVDPTTSSSGQIINHQSPAERSETGELNRLFSEPIINTPSPHLPTSAAGSFQPIPGQSS